MIFQISIILHIIGLTFLVGGMFIGLRAARMSQPPVELLKSIRFGYIVAGSFLVIVTGVSQILYQGLPYYFSQGWFHGKLTSGLLLVALGAFLFIKFEQVESSGQPLSRKFTGKMHAIIGILLLATVTLVILGRAGTL